MKTYIEKADSWSMEHVEIKAKAIRVLTERERVQYVHTAIKYYFDRDRGKKYRHSSFNAVLLYRGILSDEVFSVPKTALNFHLSNTFFSKKNQKNKFFLKFFFF